MRINTMYANGLAHWHKERTPKVSLFLLSLFSILKCYYYYYVKKKTKNKKQTSELVTSVIEYMPGIQMS